MKFTQGKSTWMPECDDLAVFKPPQEGTAYGWWAGTGVHPHRHSRHPILHEARNDRLSHACK